MELRKLGQQFQKIIKGSKQIKVKTIPIDMLWGIMSCCCVQLLLISSLTAGQVLIPVLTPNCSSDGTYSSGSSYQRNLNKLLLNMTSESSKTGFYEHTEGTGSDQVYGTYLCQGRLPADNCSQCVSAAYNGILTNCPNQIGAQTWYDQCILKYSNANFFGEWTQDDSVTWCSTGTYFNSSGAQLNNTLYGTLAKVAKQAAGDQTRFATMEVDLTFIHGSPTLYTSAQCVPDLSADTCLRCLNQSITFQFPRFCDDTVGGRTVSSSCIIRYDVGRFYTSDQVAATSPPALPPVSPPKGKGKGLYIILGILTPVVVLLILGMWCYLRNRKRLNDFEGIDMEEITAADSFQMDFNKVRAATRNFAPDKKLGEGGFGDVFKGTLENGQEIAVKRLTTSNSGQGAAEFKNEVVLVAKLQHRNLVKLLGFCISGKEKILVYEYLPNSSLDKVLFDPIKRASLDWEKRFNIICGIAKGLLYLHEDSRLRIIHRDLKSSNVLLDEAMNPKISDFGIAKTLALDQTRASTGTLAGTYGYMAPEYVLTGQYSLKSDIYSFGIMVLEIVTGQRNRFYGRPLLEEALLHRAWRLWNENAELEMVDSALNDAYSMEELVKCIHIGLLCIQEDAGKRPNMTSVVAALSGKSVDLPAPAPPNFFNISRSVSVISGSTSVTTSSTITTTGTSQSSLLPIPVDD